MKYGTFRYSDDNKRYHTLYYHNLHTYGKRVFKAAINAGFTCPNIDGRAGRGGCIFCEGGSGYFTADSTVNVFDQFIREKERIYKKYPGALISAYFQSHTNTYADVKALEGLYREAISAGADMLSIATRADCIDSEKLDMIRSLGVPVTVELGLQTADDTTAKRINRCHTYDDFLRGYELVKKSGIRVCVHIINGLPGESREIMLKTAEKLGSLAPDGVKIHLLHVIRGTALCDMYEKGLYIPLTKEEYTDTAISQLELLPAETVIERITGDGDKRTLAAPLWSADKISVLGEIDRKMAERDTWQGRKSVLN